MTQPLTISPSGHTLASRPAQLDYILLDGSSSMQDLWYDALAAIDAFVNTSHALGTNSHVRLATFDSTDSHFLQRDTTSEKWADTARTEPPIGAFWGSTPLYDAINTMGRKIDSLNPVRCSILICTDGLENASRHTNLTQARAILDWLRAKGYQVTFFGCDFANHEQASLLGGQPSAAIGVQRKLLSDAARTLARKRAAYGAAGTPMHFTESEQQQFGGHLAPPRSTP